MFYCEISSTLEQHSLLSPADLWSHRLPGSLTLGWGLERYRMSFIIFVSAIAIIIIKHKNRPI